MHITTSTGDVVTLLEVTGEVDLSTADELRDAAVAAMTPYAGTVRIDLAGVTFMDSTGLAALIAVYRMPVTATPSVGPGPAATTAIPGRAVPVVPTDQATLIQLKAHPPSYYPSCGR